MVFKIVSASGISNEHTLELRELEVLGQDANATYFVLAGDGGRAFASALREYAAGDDVEGASSTLKSLYNNIDLVEAYGPEDRAGVGVLDLDLSGEVTVDVTTWPSENRDDAEARMTLLNLTVGELGGRVSAKTVSRRYSMARCVLPGSGMAGLLDLYVVQSVRTPPVPYIDPSDWRDADAGELSIEWTPSASIGLLDDLPAVAHPLIGSHVTVVSPAVDIGRSWNIAGNHGTMTSGLALNADFANDLRAGSQIHLSGDVVAIRVLEPDANGLVDATRFPPEALPEQLIVDSIRKLHGERGVRVFNLSFGFDSNFTGSHIGELSEMLDNLIRELDIVIVVAAGNVSIPISGAFATGETLSDSYPSYLDLPANGLGQPANAASVLTVGGIAKGDAPRESSPPQLHKYALAPVGHISPFSRTGPGHGSSNLRMNKPDFVAPAGNVVLDDFGMADVRDQSTGVLTTSLNGSGSLFSVAHGTSFASPVVAADVASVLHAYPDSSSNLLRALVAASASMPVGGAQIPDEFKRHKRYGFGIVSRPDALDSTQNRVTMMYDGDMAVDTAVIHPVPMPREFALPRSSSRRIRVTLAYNPPVRRTRREYTAATMVLDAYRGVELSELEERLAHQDPDTAQPLYGDRRRLTKFRPPATQARESTLQVRDWAPPTLDLDDGDTYYVIVTHSSRTWFRNRDDYTRQPYALTVSLMDEARVELDLVLELTQRVSVPARQRAARVRT